MVEILPEATRRLVEISGPAPDATQQEMQAHAESESFPIIGPAVGGLLATLAQVSGAERVFEFGSGFGYSAAWFARGMTGGEIVLTEFDAAELDQAEEFLSEAGYAPSFRYELGDAVEQAETESGPFDIVLIDHQKSRYPAAFDRIREKVRPGGVIVADNIMRAAHEIDDVLGGLEGTSTPDDDTAEVVTYVERLREDSGYESVVLPLGNGIALSARRR